MYFHGGGFVLGSIGIMENVAKELCHASGAVVISVGYRLAPEDPYPAGLDDCEKVTRWAIANASTFGVPASKVAIAGESAGGNLSAALALRLRDAGDVQLAGQVLIYPGTSGSQRFPSRDEFAGLVLNEKSMVMYWDAYTAGRDLDDDPYAAPLHAEHLRDLPPAIVILGGCDLLRDEGRAYADRLREDDVDVEEVCYAGQPHGFVNFDFPAAAPRPRGDRHLAPREARRRLTFRRRYAGYDGERRQNGWSAAEELGSRGCRGGRWAPWGVRGRARRGCCAAPRWCRRRSRCRSGSASPS